MTITEYLQNEFPGATVELSIAPEETTRVFTITDKDRAYVLKLGRSFYELPEHEHIARLEQFAAAHQLRTNGEFPILVTSTGVTPLNTRLIGRQN